MQFIANIGKATAFRVRQDMIYIAVGSQIIVYSITRYINCKDAIKQKIQIQSVPYIDTLTQQYNDAKKGQFDFVQFAVKDGTYPIVQSSVIKNRLLCFEYRGIKDFDFQNNDIISLFSNGTMSRYNLISREQFQIAEDKFCRAFAIHDNQLVLYYDNVLQVKDKSHELSYQFQDLIIFSDNLVGLFSTEGVICIVKDALQYIQLQCFNMFIDDNQLYFQNLNGLYIIKEMSHELTPVQIQVANRRRSKMQKINNDYFYKDGFINNQQCLQSIDLIQQSQNSLVRYIIGKNENKSEQSLYFYVQNYNIKQVIQKLLDNIAKKIIMDYTDLYLYQFQKLELIEYTLKVFDSKSEHKNKFDYGIILYMLTKEKEVYELLHLEYLKQQQPNTLIQQQISVYQKSIIQYADCCPICNDQLISYNRCPNHILLRCHQTAQLVVKYEKKCQNCLFQTSKVNLNQCPICLSRLKTLP